VEEPAVATADSIYVAAVQEVAQFAGSRACREKGQARITRAMLNFRDWLSERQASEHWLS
jgi:hypothetical protein